MSFFIYNPGQKSRKDSIAEFVLRQHEYDDIMSSLERSTMEYPAQHFMIVGQRGMGKTTLLRRLQIGIEDSDKLKNWLIPILFTEEQYQITTLVDLWEYLAEYLEDLGDFSGLSAPIRAIHYHPHLEERAFESIKMALQAKGKKLVLLLDNLGELFKKLEPLEMHRLRAILQTENCLRMVGGAISLEDLLDYHKPFYDFFKIIRLEGLNREEALRFILQLADIREEKETVQRLLAEYPGRVETLRILTGGVPRTIAILFGIFLDKEHDEAIKDLYGILDIVTPLYKHRMEDLPIQQQKIMDAVARQWVPVTVNELVEKTRLISKTLSAQLNAMEKDQLIIKHDTDNKNKTYQVRERFWNIWYLMRYGRREDKAKVVWLVKFLESWLSADDLEERISALVGRVKNGESNDEQLAFLSRVYASLNNLTVDSKLMLKEIEKEMKVKVDLSDAELDKSAADSFKKGDIERCIIYFFSKEQLTSPDYYFFAELASSINVAMYVSKALTETPMKVNPVKGFLFLHIAILVNALKSINDDASNGISYHLIKKGLSLLTIDLFCELGTSNEFGFAMQIVYLIFKELIKLGLYKAVLVLIEEASGEIDTNRPVVFLKDFWRPLYLAVKYLYQPTELDKQPAELREPAERLVRKLLEI